MEFGEIGILVILENFEFCLISRGIGRNWVELGGIGWNRDFEDFGKNLISA